MTSGRPSAVLDDAQCQTIWQMASPNGATISQDQAVPYIAGQTFYEAPDDVHIVGRNASKTESAKLVVFLVKDKGAPVVIPAQ
jgi:hypothetical protein